MIPARFLLFAILSLATNFLAHARPGIAAQWANSSADSSVINSGITSGSVKRQYGFAANCTYPIRLEAWGGSFRFDDWCVFNETGTDIVEGDKLTINLATTYGVIHGNISLAAGTTEAPKPADQGQELLVPRFSLPAEVSQGYKHIREIGGPIRKVAAGQIGNAYLWESNAYITVIGTISDVGVQTVLRLIGERVLDATKVTGDEMYAVVQLGDPKRDACCTTTILFGSQTGSWEQLADIWRSH